MTPESPPSNPAGRNAPGFRWVLLGLAVLGSVAVALLFFHRPAGQFFFPRCTFHQMTGLLCPGCGGLRAGHELLNGRLLEAARCNLLLVVGLPATLLTWIWARRRHTSVDLNAKTVWILFGIAAAFTLVRNLPGPFSHWLAP